MLKAEVAGIGFPEKGTPQGGIISPLLSNIVLNVLLNLNEPDRVVMSEEPDEGDKPRPRTADRER